MSAKTRRDRFIKKEPYPVEFRQKCPTPQKVAHFTRRAARAARKQHPQEQLGVYLCECGAYHVGSLMEGGSREGARRAAEGKLT